MNKIYKSKIVVFKHAFLVALVHLDTKCISHEFDSYDIQYCVDDDLVWFLSAHACLNIRLIMAQVVSYHCLVYSCGGMYCLQHEKTIYS